MESTQNWQVENTNIINRTLCLSTYGAKNVDLLGCDRQNIVHTHTYVYISHMLLTTVTVYIKSTVQVNSLNNNDTYKNKIQNAGYLLQRENL